VLDELEARLACHDNQSEIEEVILKLGYRKLVVTMGANGALCYDGTTFHLGKVNASEVLATL